MAQHKFYVLWGAVVLNTAELCGLYGVKMAELPYAKHCRNELIKHSFCIDHVKNIYFDFWAEGSKHLSQLGEQKYRGLSL